MSALQLWWLRLRLWGVERDILQIQWRQQQLRADLAEWQEQKRDLEMQIFAAERVP